MCISIYGPPPASPGCRPPPPATKMYTTYIINYEIHNKQTIINTHIDKHILS